MSRVFAQVAMEPVRVSGLPGNVVRRGLEAESMNRHDAGYHLSLLYFRSFTLCHTRTTFSLMRQKRAISVWAYD